MYMGPTTGYKFFDKRERITSLTSDNIRIIIRMKIENPNGMTHVTVFTLFKKCYDGVWLKNVFLG